MSGLESATDRLGRLLTLVPWLLDHQGVSVEEAARTFGISPEQLDRDLSLLFLCGTPGHLPDDLIEADWEDGRVFLGNADSLKEPLRLSLDEALTLMVGLRALGAAGAVGGSDVVERTLAKLEAATGAVAADTAARVRVSLSEDDASQVLRVASQALQDGRRLHVRYLVPSRDETTERDVSPMRLLSMDSHWYLEAWCHRADDVRLFRLDRVDDITMLAEPSTPPRDVAPRDLGAGAFVPRPADLRVVVETTSAARWIEDYYPTEQASSLPGGRRRLVLRTSDPGWIVRLMWRVGGAARVVEPAEVVEAVRAGAAQAAAAYESSNAT